MALLGFVVWTVFLLLGVGAWRVFEVATKKTHIGGFTPGTPHGSDRYWRLNRAHLNCVENLPLLGAVILTGHVLGESTGLFATLTQVYLGARVVQSTIHVSSGSAMAIRFRFAAFGVQVISILVMVGVLFSRHA